MFHHFGLDPGPFFRTDNRRLDLGLLIFFFFILYIDFIVDIQLPNLEYRNILESFKEVEIAKKNLLMPIY